MIYLSSTNKEFKIDVTILISGGNYELIFKNFRTRETVEFTKVAAQETDLFAKFELSNSEFNQLKKDEHELTVKHFDYSSEKPIFTGIVKVF